MNIAHFEVSIQTIKNSVFQPRNCMMSNRGSQTMLISGLGPKRSNVFGKCDIISLRCTLVKSGYAKTILVRLKLMSNRGSHGDSCVLRKCFTKVRNGHGVGRLVNQQTMSLSTNKYHKCHSWPV